MTHQPTNRIAFLDGLRGVSILLVLCFHAYAGWSELYPYGQKFFNCPLFTYGWLGVSLFFLISGFVILMTLEKCRSFHEFILRRWLRLFPAMLICSALVFATARFFPERPKGLPVWRDVLPGLTFIEPLWLERILGPHQGLLEDSYWSIFVEMKFYVLFGLLYFFAGWKKAIGLLFCLFAMAAATTFLGGTARDVSPHILHWTGRLSGILSAQYFGWFAAGALFYRYAATGGRSLLVCAIGLMLASAATVRGGTGASLTALIVGLLFASSVIFSWPKKVLAHPSFLFMGFISYPLYLLHENMMVAMIVKVGRVAPRLPAMAMPLLPMGVIILLAWGVARWLEPWTRRVIRSINQT